MVVANTPEELLDDIPVDDTVDGESFAALLDAYDYDRPYRGQILEGTVLKSGHDEVLVDVGLKRDAIVPRRDLLMLDDKHRDKLVPGAEILTYVLQPSNQDGDLIVSVNRALELEDWQEANKLMAEDTVVEAEVVGTNRGGLLVRFGRLTGFVPQSHLVNLARFRSDDELETAKRDVVGEKLTLKFIEIDRPRNRLIFSERLARAHSAQHRLSQLNVGQVVTGRVVSIVKFGAFVDLGGVDGLVHISKLSHRHVSHPGEVVAVGDEIEVRIDEIDQDNNRISLNHLVLLPDPWESIMEEFHEGALVEGVVTNTVDFGAFIELPNGLQGLVHISKMSVFGSSNPRDVVREGDTLLVRIISIDPERRRIALSIDDVTVEEQEAWMYSRRPTEVDEVFEDMVESDQPEASADDNDDEESAGTDETDAPVDSIDLDEIDKTEAPDEDEEVSIS